MTIRASTPRRPLGVWILTILDSLIMGLIPVLGSLAIFFGLVDAGRPPYSWTTFFDLCINGALLLSAIEAWRGSNRGRIGLLALIVVYQGINFLNGLLLLSADALTPSQRSYGYALLFRASFWTLLNFWYFLRSTTRAWYTLQ